MDSLFSSSLSQLKLFENQNNVVTDEFIFKDDSEEQAQIMNEKPWCTNPKYFTKCKISLLAILKMLSHSVAGGTHEVMGLPLGRVQGTSFIIIDTFPLPVESTETQVNASSKCNEFMIKTLEMQEQVGRKENVRGWYHSHPSYGCWMSGIDVATQRLQQTQDPMVAIVIDPVKTIETGILDIEAFRTYPEHFKPWSLDNVYSNKSSIVNVPLDKKEDYGFYYQQYYSLEVSIFKNSLDQELLESLWKNWGKTIASSPLLTNEGYFTQKLERISKIPSSNSSQNKGSTELTEPSIIQLSGNTINSSREKQPVQYALELDQALLKEALNNLLFSYKI